MRQRSIVSRWQQMAAKGHGQKLSRHGERVLAALLSHPTIGAAASASNISERTIFRWLQREDFQQRYNDARRSVVDDSIRDLHAATGEAVATLRRNLNCGNHHAENRAAMAILSQSLNGVAISEQQERIERLEALITDMEKSRRPRRV